MAECLRPQRRHGADDPHGDDSPSLELAVAPGTPPHGRLVALVGLSLFLGALAVMFGPRVEGSTAKS